MYLVGYALNHRYVTWTVANLCASSENLIIILYFSAQIQTDFLSLTYGQVAYCSETWVHIYRTSRRHVPDNRRPYIQYLSCGGGGGHALASLLEALGYKPEVRLFDSRYCNWNFSLLQSFQPLNVPGVNTGRYIAWEGKEDSAYG